MNDYSGAPVFMLGPFKKNMVCKSEVPTPPDFRIAMLCEVAFVS